jgi:hypothetical protein
MKFFCSKLAAMLLTMVLRAVGKTKGFIEPKGPRWMGGRRDGWIGGRKDWRCVRYGWIGGRRERARGSTLPLSPFGHVARLGRWVNTRGLRPPSVRPNHLAAP